ncbi:MAG: DUF190 domain-containing protein [Hyphomicrobium sp.]
MTKKAPAHHLSERRRHERRAALARGYRAPPAACPYCGAPRWFHGVMGYGKHHQVHRKHLLGVADDRPVTVDGRRRL